MHVGVVSGFYDYAWRTDQIDRDFNEKLRGQAPGSYRPYKVFHITSVRPLSSGMF